MFAVLAPFLDVKLYENEMGFCLFVYLFIDSLGYAANGLKPMCLITFFRWMNKHNHTKCFKLTYFFEYQKTSAFIKATVNFKSCVF